ncbi:hypothetical protein, partial [Planktothrix sp.]|uniref:hypothetical protein n=1 Tax=Planktothrix sp. TaxID=3088171 RepID=UPI0038D43AC5
RPLPLPMVDLSSIAKLQRLRHPKVVQQEQTIYQPSWQCYCCRESGLIIWPYKVIEGYQEIGDLPLLCNRPGCSAASHLRQMGLDERVSPEICQLLHDFSVEDWKVTVKLQWSRAKQIAEQIHHLAQTKSLRPEGCDRTENDEREIQIRKENAQAWLDARPGENIRENVQS